MHPSACNGGVVPLGGRDPVILLQQLMILQRNGLVDDRADPVPIGLNSRVLGVPSRHDATRRSSSACACALRLMCGISNSTIGIPDESAAEKADDSNVSKKNIASDQLKSSKRPLRTSIPSSCDILRDGS
jgi:hypothetical protein